MATKLPPSSLPTDREFCEARSRELAAEFAAAVGAGPAETYPPWLLNAYRILLQTAFALPKGLNAGKLPELRKLGINMALLANLVRIHREEPLNFEPADQTLFANALEFLKGMVKGANEAALNLPRKEDTADYFDGFARAYRLCAAGHEALPLTLASHRYVAVITYWREVEQCANRREVKRMLEAAGLLDTISEDGWNKFCDGFGLKLGTRGRPRKSKMS